MLTLALSAFPAGGGPVLTPAVHSRLSTSQGPVHVAIPPRGAAVTVVYVHGFWTHVDDAWVHHRLTQQLTDSGVEAALIVPEAPARPRDAVNFADLAELLTEVERQTGVALPEQVIAVGHSGAYLTLGSWVASPRLKAVVLLDAFYGSTAPWERYLARGGHLRVVARATAARSAPFCARHRQVVCERSGQSHMEIVSGGEVIPRVLREVAESVLPGV
jgi:hypothetical protein